MSLLPAQLTSLKTHLLANTNQVVNLANGQLTNINALLTDTSGNFQQIANWYNGTALGTDAQPFTAPLMVWRPRVLIAELNSAVQWNTPPVGADQPTITNAWLLYMAMTQAGYIDMTDGQVRKGIIQVFGVQAAGNTTLTITTTVGQQAARRIELVLPKSGLVGSANSGPQAYVSTVFGYTMTEDDIRQAIDNG